ncbi:MAG: helix-turn-helix transcriptional regulator [Alphaproteobacteria bacterium]|nr:helix-turn-helix transcriptional regulator [Alphaproteobacteria bacterium]MBT5389395.1 helix-turn-helix transcriptional regulator [Alphaproteobacteria bacterium]MBT5654139.1 helix-turn-helix transcriptional regulator [Alphaproteobacteria bacterium]
MKETARHINISHRTVESYCESLKMKFDCATKSELISLFLQYNTKQFG